MPAGSITPADIQSADWSLMLDSSSQSHAAAAGLGNVVQGVADVNQCIAIILGTPKGADPLRPTFGADLWQYIDYPIQAAIPAIAREITEAITLWNRASGCCRCARDWWATTPRPIATLICRLRSYGN